MPTRRTAAIHPGPVVPPAWHQLLRRLVWPLLLLGLLAPSTRAGSLPGELPALVGRINVLAGELQLQDRDSGQWQRADDGSVSNWPVATGDRLRLLGRDARADLRIGSTTLRLAGDAQLWLQQLDEQAVLLQLQGGTVALRLAATDGDAFGPVELRTREGRWLPRRPGHYRFDRDRDATQASVWRGELQFEGFDSALTIPERRRADLWLDGPGDSRRSTTRYAWATVERDAFADWVARDEHQDDAAITARHVPPGMTGWQDLDRHGDWVSDSDQGPLWLPRAVSPGWAPYQTGRWTWVAPWGWTWIDAAPWGFAPFHYGHWVRFDGRWAWSPGPRGPRVRYAPALSAWIGGPAVGVTVTIGGHRPPPPRVVVPAVPVVVVRPDHHHHRPVTPPVVVVPRPGWHAADPLPPRRWDDRRDDRHDDRRDQRGWDRHVDRHVDRNDGRNDSRNDGRGGDHRAVPVVPVVVPVTPAPPVAQTPEIPRMTIPRPIGRATPPAEPVAMLPTPRALRDEAPRANRPESRPESRPDGRPDARQESRQDGRNEGRNEGRREAWREGGREIGRDGSREIRTEARAEPRDDARRDGQRSGPGRISDRELAR